MLMLKEKYKDLLNSLLHEDVVVKLKETMGMKSSLIKSFLYSLDSVLDMQQELLHIVELIDSNLTQLLLKLNEIKRRK